jgi:DNA-binding response OmpR family regulator
MPREFTRRLRPANVAEIRPSYDSLMDRPAPAAPPDFRSQVSRPLEHLTPQERAIYSVLADNVGRVLSRSELARAVGIADLSERRCDSLIVGVRRVVGSSRVRTVRRRGWMLVG